MPERNRFGLDWVMGMAEREKVNWDRGIALCPGIVLIVAVVGIVADVAIHSVVAIA